DRETADRGQEAEREAPEAEDPSGEAAERDDAPRQPPERQEARRDVADRDHALRVPAQLAALRVGAECYVVERDVADAPVRALAYPAHGVEPAAAERRDLLLELGHALFEPLTIVHPPLLPRASRRRIADRLLQHAQHVHAGGLLVRPRVELLERQ